MLSRLALCSVFAVPAAAQHWFQAPRLTQEVVGLPTAGLGDFDHDGAVDVFCANNAATRVYRNDGNALFPQLLAETLMQPGELASAAVLADFDGDGELDLVNGQSGATIGVRVHRGLGNGALDAGTLVPLSAGLHSLCAGQADADAALELGVATLFVQPGVQLEYRVQWIDWNGAAFVAGANSVGQVLNWGAGTLAAVDGDGDGRDDLVLASQGVLYTYATGASPLDRPASPAPTPLGIGNPTSTIHLFGWDFDADGARDLLAYHGNPSAGYGLVLLEAQPGSGWQVGPFQTPPLNNTRIFAGDWDGDGDSDLVMNAPIALYGGMRLLRYDAGGTFANAGSGSAVYVGNGGGLADLDLDGFLDFSGPGSVVHGNGSFTTFNGGPLAFNAYQGTGLEPRDIEGDGDLDLPQQSASLVNDGSGSATSVTLWPTAPAQHFYVNNGVLGDWDGDGRDDWVVGLMHVIPPFQQTFKGNHLLRDDGSGHFVDVGLAADLSFDWTPFGGLDTLTTYAFDVDQDGDKDILRPSGYFRNAGGGTFDAAIPLPTLGKPLRIADFDGDGQLEILALLDAATDSLLLHDVVAPATFATTTLASAATLMPNSSWQDLDGDGDRDIAGTSFDGAAYRPVIVPRTPSGFGAPIVLNLAQLNNAARVAAEDLDGDGFVELLVGGTNGALVAAHPGTAQPFEYGAARVFQAGQVLGFEDIDEDGDLDIVGALTSEGRRFHGASAGGAKQYGAGTPGSGGAVPLLGASGPFRAGSTSATLNLVRAKGPAPTFLVVGAAEGNVPNYPLAGLNALVDPFSFLALVQIPAAGSGVGDGEWHLNIDVDPGLAGNTFFHQAFVVDVGIPGLVAQSNGLRISYAP